MKRLFTSPLLAVALAACGSKAPELAQTAAPVQEAPAAEVRVACPAESETIAAFSLRAREGGESLRPELLETPVRGRCESRDIVFSQLSAMPRSVSSIETSSGTKVAFHKLNDATALASSNLVLAAAETGLWALDSKSMARVARLVPNRIIAVVATPDAKRFAYIRQDPKVGSETQDRELVVVDVDGLAVVRRFTKVPEGRLRISNDGAAVLIARGEDGVSRFDVASGRTSSFVVHATVEDVFETTGSPRLVGTVGESNQLELRSVPAFNTVAQSTSDALPLVASRNLRTLSFDSAAGRWIVGGDDGIVHEYTGLPGAAPSDARQMQIGGPVVGIACCTDGAYAATSSSATLAWIKDGAIVRQVGPFLDDFADANIQLSLLGEDTLVSMIGRVFVWTSDGLFVTADFMNGQVIASAVIGDETIFAVRSHSSIEFHRTKTNAGLATTTTLVKSVEWQTVDQQFVTGSGDLLFVGRAYTRAAIAIIPANGEPKFIIGPNVGVGRVPVTVAQGDGVHFSLWDLQSTILGIDASEGTITPLLRVEGDAPRSATLSRVGDSWKLVDDAGATRTLAAIEANGAPSPMPTATPTPAPGAPVRATPTAAPTPAPRPAQNAAPTPAPSAAPTPPPSPVQNAAPTPAPSE